MYGVQSGGLCGVEPKSKLCWERTEWNRQIKRWGCRIFSPNWTLSDFITEFVQSYCQLQCIILWRDWWRKWLYVVYTLKHLKSKKGEFGMTVDMIKNHTLHPAENDKLVNTVSWHDQLQKRKWFFFYGWKTKWKPLKTYTTKGITHNFLSIGWRKLV